MPNDPARFLRDITNNKLSGDEIHQFVKKNRLPLYEYLYKNIFTSNKKDSSIIQALEYIIFYTDDLNFKSWHGRPLLFDVIEKRDIDMFYRLVRGGASLSYEKDMINDCINLLYDNGLFLDNDAADLIFGDFEIVSKLAFSPDRILELYKKGGYYAIALYFTLRSDNILDHEDLMYEIIKDRNNYLFDFLLENGLTLNTRLFGGQSVLYLVENERAVDLILSLFFKYKESFPIDKLEYYIANHYFKKIKYRYYLRFKKLETISKGRMKTNIQKIILMNKEYYERLHNTRKDTQNAMQSKTTKKKRGFFGF